MHDISLAVRNGRQKLALFVVVVPDAVSLALVSAESDKIDLRLLLLLIKKKDQK